MPALLEDLRPQPTPGIEDGEMIDFGYRPVFKEHTNREGVPFDRKAMERIAARCNSRIEESKDFCPIAIRHTQDGGGFDPEVIGLLGPFRAQKMPGSKGKWAVYGRERIYKEDAHKRRKYPRLSVEYWAEESDPTGGYFDPVSLLGAETPELDLGVHYSADPNNPNRRLMRYQRVIRYEAAAPGGANTSVPAGISDDKPTRYESGSLSQADIQQIVAALKPVIDEAVEAKVGAMNPAGADPDNLLTDAVPDEHSDMPPEADGMGPTPEELNFEAPGDDQDDDSDLDAPGDDDDTDMDEGSAEIDDTITEDGAEPSEKKPAKYSADGRESTSVSLEEPDMADEMELARYRKEAADYRKKHDDLHAKYQKLEAESVKLKAESEASKLKEMKAVRYQKLAQVQSEGGFTFDLDEEAKDCEGLNDAQFDRHVEKIKANYQRVPGSPLPTSAIAGPARTVADDRNDQKKRVRYSKLAADNCLKAKAEKKVLEFGDEFNRLMQEDPEGLGSKAA